jgi:GAF domain-containing protein
MSGDLTISKGAGKEILYAELMPQIEHLIADETDLVANLANIVAALKEAMDFLWVGFYLVKAGELVLGPFQGPVACTRIAHGKGVCGTAWKEQRTIRVDDVNQFPGHIACSSRSSSEIVLPVYKNGAIAMVLDIDSEQPAAFDHVDEQYLTRLAGIIENTVL